MYANHIVQLKLIYHTKMSTLLSAAVLKCQYFCLQTMQHCWNTNEADAMRSQRTSEAHEALNKSMCKIHILPVILGNNELLVHIYLNT